MSVSTSRGNLRDIEPSENLRHGHLEDEVLPKDTEVSP